MADQCFHLGNIWQLKGKVAAAVEKYQQTLQLEPDYIPAYLKLGLLMLKTGRVEQALAYYRQAADLAPDDSDIAFQYRYVKSFLQRQIVQPGEFQPVPTGRPLEDNPRGKINLQQRVEFAHHRSGWSWVLETLRPLHNRRGVLFDSCLEANFGWRHWKDWVNPPAVLEQMKREGTFEILATSAEKGIIPYAQPWVGVLHNPPEMPLWFDYQLSPQAIFAKDVFQRSLEHCLGIFTLSDYLAKWVRQRIDKPVSSLIHPTEIPEIQFDFARFNSNPQKKIVQIGMWLRRVGAIYQLPIARDNPMGYRKIRLVPCIHVESWHGQLLRREQQADQLEMESKYSENTWPMGPLPDSEYDALLSENIVFLSLYDSSANNTIIECIARATPLLVNPLPAVVEYLGPDYPMYYEDLREAASKAMDLGLIEDTHGYLKNCATRRRISPDYFLKTFTESEVYRAI